MKFEATDFVKVKLSKEEIDTIKNTIKILGDIISYAEANKKSTYAYYSWSDRMYNDIKNLSMIRLELDDILNIDGVE